MNEKSIREALRETRQKLAGAIRQRDQLNVTILQLQNQAASLSKVLVRDALIGKQQHAEESALGLTEMIRTVLRLTAQPMTAADIKRTLTVMGFDFGNFSNPSAAVHNTLKRMVTTGELVYMDAKGYRLKNVLY